jgi:hypothetical protein
MLVLQSGLLVWGAFAILRRVTGERTAAWCAVGVLLFPPLINTTGLVSAEAQLAGCFVAGIAGLLSSRRAYRLLGLGALVLGVGMRDGVALAALPIVLGLWPWRRRPLALVAWVAIALAAFGLERACTNKHTLQPEERLAHNDIANILRNAPPITDAHLRDVLAGTPLRFDSDIQQHAVDRERLFDANSTTPERAAMIAARRRLIREEPAAWLVHRARRLHAELEPPPALYTSFVSSEAEARAINHWSRHSLVQRVLIAPVRWLSGTVLFRPYLYAILALVLLPLAIAWRQRVAIVVLASGILYELSLAVVSTRPAYRDSHWMIVATVLATVLLVIHRARPESIEEKPGV